MRLRSQRGFTLMEMMASMSATAVVVAAATALLIRCFTWYDELSAKLAINRHARETYEILSLGGKSGSSGNDGTQYLYGIRERKQAPSTGSMRSNYAFTYSSNNLTLTPDKTSSMTISCAGSATPMPDCTGNGSKTVSGWMGNDTQVDTSNRSVSGKTVEVTMTVMNPYQIQRAKSPTVFAELYRTVFTLNRNENDP